MRYLISIAVLCLVVGGGLVLYSLKFPIYTDPNAPDRLSVELESSPREQRFDEWYSRLHAYETPRKPLSDVGRGLMAFGGGLLSVRVFWFFYHQWSRLRNIWVVLAVWVALWAIRVPFTQWYYEVRYRRSDYPEWGDSIGIGVISECVTWVVGAIVTTPILALLLDKRRVPTELRLERPTSGLGWARAVFIGIWLALLGWCVWWGITDGNEGMVLACTVAAWILLITLRAEAKPHTIETADHRGATPA